MPEGNGGEAHGRLLRTVDDHTDDIKQLQSEVATLKMDSSSTKAIFHLMTREKELTVKNLEMSITTQWFTRIGVTVGVLSMLITAVWIIGHSPRP